MTTGFRLYEKRQVAEQLLAESITGVFYNDLITHRTPFSS